MTSSLVSASAVPEPLVSVVTDARRVTGASPAADPANVTDTPTCVIRGLEPASAAGTTQEEISVTGVPMVTMVIQFWAKHPVVSVVRAPVQTAPTADATLLHLVTRTTAIDKSSATVTRVTQEPDVRNVLQVIMATPLSPEGAASHASVTTT